MDVGGTVIGHSGIEGTIGGRGGVGLDCGFGIGYELGPVIFLLASASPCPILGLTEEAIDRGWGTGLGTLRMSCGIPSLLD